MSPRQATNARTRASDARLDDLRAQAQYARQRYDLYKAKAYGPRLTSPSRMRELQRASERAEANLRFAAAEAKRDGDQAGSDHPPSPENPATQSDR